MPKKLVGGVRFWGCLKIQTGVLIEIGMAVVERILSSMSTSEPTDEDSI